MKLRISQNTKSKFNNKRVELDGFTFASKAEAKRYTQLKMLERIGEISELELQPRYPLEVNGKKIATYIADFRYRVVLTNKFVVEDVKSTATKTPVYRLKKKLVEALTGVSVTEIF